MKLLVIVKVKLGVGTRRVVIPFRMANLDERVSLVIEYRVIEYQKLTQTFTALLRTTSNHLVL